MLGARSHAQAARPDRNTIVAALQEETMEEGKKPAQSNPIAWLGRFILFICSSGYLFPHVCTESMDMKEYEANLQKKS
jgi:hypothetical protein